MLRSIQDLQTLQADGRPGRSTFNQKPGEFTPDQTVAVMTHNQMKIDRTVSRILEMFDWYYTSRLVAVAGHFKCWVGADNPGERWLWVLLDFANHNICFDIKQLVEVLHCNLQMSIHQGLTEAQANILKAIAGFIDHFHISDNSVCSSTCSAGPHVCQTCWYILSWLLSDEAPHLQDLSPSSRDV